MKHPWQIRLYRRSIKKKETMRAVQALLPAVGGKRCLEIGCATGTSSWLLRQRGGEWTSADFDAAQVESARRLLADDVLLLDGGGRLPFPDASFQVVVAINFLEHLENDAAFVREMSRVLQPGGSFLLTCPEAATGRIGFRLKRLYRFTAETGGFGHVRDGYRPEGLRALLGQAGLEVERLVSYSRIFTELVENSLNFIYHRSSSGDPAVSGTGAASSDAASSGVAPGNGTVPADSGHEAGTFHGETSPATDADFKSVGWKFRAYEAAYPMLRGFALLDRLIPFRPGYMFCVRARKTDISTARIDSPADGAFHPAGQV